MLYGNLQQIIGQPQSGLSLEWPLYLTASLGATQSVYVSRCGEEEWSYHTSRVQEPSKAGKTVQLRKISVVKLPITVTIFGQVAHLTEATDVCRWTLYYRARWYMTVWFCMAKTIMETHWLWSLATDVLYMQPELDATRLTVVALALLPTHTLSSYGQRLQLNWTVHTTDCLYQC